MSRAIIHHGDRSTPLTGSFTLIGRDANCDIVLHDDSVSKKHAFIVREESIFSIHDFKSVNKVTYKGRPVESIRLSSGMEFELGNERLKFTIEEEEGGGHIPLIPPLLRPAAARQDTDQIFRASIEKDIAEILSESRTRRDDPYQRLLILYKVAGIVNSMLETDELLEKILRLALDVMEADRGSIMLLKPDGKLEPEVSITPSREEGKEDIILDFSLSIAMECCEKNQSVLSNDALGDERFRSSESIVAYDIRSAMAVPLAYKGKKLGVLYLDNRLTSNAFTDSDIELLRAFAAQAATAIENAVLMRNLRDSLAKIQNQREMLIQSEKMAAMGQLAAGVAHEIRNPLTAISGYLQMYFQRFPDTTPFHKQMKVMNQAVNQIRGVLEGLLGFSRKSENRWIETPINQVVEQTLALANHTLSRYRNVSVITHLDQNLPLVSVDPRQIQQVFLNFMINAAQAMPDGGTLTITTRTLDEPDGPTHPSHLIVLFSDTGLGIPEDKQSQIFQPFFTSGKKDGVGLGLTISKTIIETHGGTLTFESVEGKGTTFFIKLPLPAPEPA